MTLSPGAGRYDEVRKELESFACSSVSSAVISFVVDAIERRSSGCLAQATCWVEISTTIALGAVTVSGQAGSAAARAADAPASSAQTAAASTAATCLARSRITGGA